MADKSAIEWTDATWNPIVGCSIVSPGCTNCYAMKMAARIEKMNRTGGSNSNYVNHYDGTTQATKAGAVWTGKVAIAPDKLFLKPLSWKQPRRVFVNSMGDLFHESIPDEWIDRVFAVMALSPQHTFQVLTKRAERMRAYVAAPERGALICGKKDHVGAIRRWPAEPSSQADRTKACEERVSPRNRLVHWPLQNVWLGVSTERQQEADERIPLLLQTPAAVRFISAEPLLGPIDLERINRVDGRGSADVNALGGEVHYPGAGSISSKTIRGTKILDWIIVGGESGHGARPMHPQWATDLRDLRDQCASSAIPFFYKQTGEWLSIVDRDEQDPDWRENYTLTRDQPKRYCIINRAGGCGFHGERVHMMERVGKAKAGRLLDGKEHNEFPQAKEVVFE